MVSEAAYDWARSGVVPLTGPSDGPPLPPPGRAATAAARSAEHIAAATAGDHRHRVLLNGPQLLAERAAFTGGRRRGRTSVGGSCRLLRTADGWAAVSVARPDDPLLWSALIGAGYEADGFEERLAAWIAAHPGAELDERAELLGLAGHSVAERGAADPPSPGPPRSVAGTLVVDFSALWAGPLCAQLLGLAGAEIVKVETPQRPDGARFGNPDFYDLLHSGPRHRSVVLDPAVPGERAALQALVRRADIVIEASRPRALAGFGLDAEAEVARGCTWLSITAAGRASERIGFGDDVAAAAGLVARDAAGLPAFCGDALADPLTGLTAAALAMSQPAGGAGVLWDVAMANVVAGTLDGPPAEDTGEIVSPQPPTARRPRSAAPAMGADTSTVLRRLGLGIPA
jgi:hypothetical protein